MKFKLFVLSLLSISMSEVYDGYTLYTPGGGFGVVSLQLT